MIISPEDLIRIRKEHSKDTIVFCSGTYDMVHPGHVHFFEQCKKYGNILVVAIGDDETIKEYKKPPRPIWNEFARLKMVDSLKPVDYAFLYRAKDDHPIVLDDDFFENLRPDVYAVNRDASNMAYRRKIAEQYQARFIVADEMHPSSFPEFSTTKIIKKILDAYIPVSDSLSVSKEKDKN